MASPENKPDNEAAPAGRPELLAVLQKAKNALAYLSHNDWMLLTDKAKSISFKAGDALLQRGRQTQQVFFLLEGKAKVEKQAGKKLAQIGPGEICGEMAFLEQSSSSASVIAEEKVRAYVLDWRVMEELFQLYPHLGSRFYRSLALNLSRRLRDLIG